MGYLDTVRISDIARYSGNSFPNPPTGDLSNDANTVILYNFAEDEFFDEMGVTKITDLSDNGYDGSLGTGFGGATSPELPVDPTPTPSPTATASPTATPTPTPTPTGQTSSPTSTPTPTFSPKPIGQTPSPTASPTPVGQTPSPTASPTPVGQTPSPTPEGQTPTPTPLPTDTPGPGDQLVWGNNNCSGPGDPPDPVDSLLTLRFDAGLSTNTGDCPPMGEVVEVANASPHPWGDVDCSGEVNPVDSLKILRFDAGLSVSQEVGCPAMGAGVTLVET